ncbi:MAG: sigma-70 family RNA polymerase sigma factor [Gemmataceae bacterium]|nr:sigma-70 family RNA polymerase sigma factor [Gemmataceae bacterium]
MNASATKSFSVVVSSLSLLSVSGMHCRRRQKKWEVQPMTMIDMTALIARARHGDQRAFHELVEHFRPTVSAVALARLRDVNEAGELTQEVFIHAFRKLDQLRDPGSFVGWLRQITVRMAINRLTRRAPWHDTDPAVIQQAAAADAGPLDDLIRAEQRAKVMAGLESLKPLDRETLTAFYLHGRSLQEMAEAFAAPVGTIKRRLHVARKRLRNVLQRGRRKGAERREVAFA